MTTRHYFTIALAAGVLTTTGCTRPFTRVAKKESPAVETLAKKDEKGKSKGESSIRSASLSRKKPLWGKDAKQEGKRTPKPMTCLKAGECLENTGDQSEDAAFRRQKYDQARRAYEQALSIDAQYQPAMLCLARLHEKENNYEMAVKLYKRALADDPKNSSVWFTLGMCWGRQKEWDAAVGCLKKAHEIEPNSPQYSNYVGWALARAGREQECLAHFAKTSGEARAHYNLALMMEHMGDAEKCHKHLQAAIEMDPKMVEAKRMMARLEGASTESSEIKQVSGE